MSHHKERIEQLERDKTDSVLALKKKMDTLEVEKTNEISQLQEMHRYVFHTYRQSNHCYISHNQICSGRYEERTRVGLAACEGFTQTRRGSSEGSTFTYPVS